jgi:ATP-dependent DNA helicase RecQ
VRCSQEGYAIDWNRIIPAQYESLIIEKIKEIGTGALKPIKEALPDAVGYDAIKAVLCKHFNGR